MALAPMAGGARRGRWVVQRAGGGQEGLAAASWRWAGSVPTRAQGCLGRRRSIEQPMGCRTRAWCCHHLSLIHI
eukprot:15020333-Alexandrium_andersonii.AAC.1